MTAGLAIIGDEILSGRTQDKNLAYLATWLNELGVELHEVRVVKDIQTRIVEAVNTLRGRYDYVFTTGGIGPTHDDITADAIAAAFGIGIDHREDAVALLKSHYKPEDLNEARLRMARIPDGAVLIDNPVSIAPGFQVENVFVMAGVPMIFHGMLESIRHRIVGGTPTLSQTVRTDALEGQIAADLGAIQQAHAETQVGSYPFARGGRLGVRVVIRSRSPDALESATNAVQAMLAARGAEAVREPTASHNDAMGE